MKRITSIIFLVLTGLVNLTEVFSQTPEMLKVDDRSLISHADLHYDQPVSRSEEGMPLGNGRMGSLVWTSPTALKLQINRVDVFANNSASNNFFERHTDYCGGVGFVDIDFVDFGEDVFTPENFSQHLSCYDGLVTTKGNGIETSIFAWYEKDVMALQIKDERTEPLPVNINLRMLRAPVTTRGNHSAISTLDIIDNRIVLKQEFREDNYYCASAVVIGSPGEKVKPEWANEFEVRLSLAPDGKNFPVFIASAASFDPHEDVVALAVENCKAAEAKGFEDLLQSNKEWWHNFWEKSFVYLHSEDGEADFIEQNYHYYLYVMASSSRGKYPPKFNGMLWTTGGDARKWGSLYWGANQSCLYNALFPTNRLELMNPMFDMYTAMYNSCAIAAQQQWGSQGIFIPETLGFDSIPELPEDIAEEMRALYLYEKPWSARSEKFQEYAFTKMPYHSRWNWKQDEGWEDGRWQISNKGGGAFGHVTHIFSRGAKLAYQYWMRYEYTLDEAWLRDRAYPMLKGVAEFYRNFPNVQKGSDGKYHIDHVNDNESIWDGHNTVEEISSMMGIFPVVIRASEILEVDAEMRPVWQEFMDNLSPLPVNKDYPDSIETGAKTRWARSLPPTLRGNGFRPPDPNTMPVWFFDLCTLETNDAEMLEVAHTTYDTYFPDGIHENTSVNVLSKLPAIGALLGRVEAAKYLIPNQIRTDETEVLPNRMDLREGYQTTSVQRLGRAADALHYALCQSMPAGPGQELIISVFLSWPKEWDAQYTLLCRGGFLVSSSMQKGEIEFVEILSQKGATCRLRNPWPATEVTVFRNGKKFESLKGTLLTFTTQTGDRFVVVPGRTLPPAKPVFR